MTSQPKELLAAIAPTAPYYRPDIDGLRAVAVLSVVLFHAFPTLAPGGFAGVDVFFVISGFLISSILITDLERRQFSVGRFYARRIVRIFPALLVLLTASLVFGWLSLLADEYALLGKHTMAGAGFVSNLALWKESSYFDVAAETKPLLHLWSLGVEEQFYLLWPLLLWGGWRLRAKPAFVVAAIGVLSFALNIHSAQRHAVADFYAPHTRFWELLAGALVACLPRERGIRRPVFLANFVACLGFGLLLAAFALLDNKRPFPGWQALLPVGGTVLLIYAGPIAALNRVLLSHPALVGIGLISYPLYLWHWPLLTFPRIVTSEALPVTERIVAITLAFALAWATWRFVEIPVRRRAAQDRRWIALLLVSMLIVATAGGIVLAKRGFAGRIAAKPIEHYTNTLGKDAYLTHISTHMQRCVDARLLQLSGNDPVYGHRCFQSQPTGPIDLLLVGDSHSEHLLPGFAAVYESRNIGSFMQYSMPSVDDPAYTEALHRIALDPNIRAIAVSALWAAKIPADATPPLESLQKTFALLVSSGKSIYVLGDIPVYPFVPEKCKYGRRFDGHAPICSIPLQQYLEQKQHYSEILHAVLKDFPTIRFVPVDSFFCDEHQCDMRHESMLLYRDHNHLNVDGSTYLARQLRDSGALVVP